MADILEIKKVSKTYNSQSDNPVIALNDVDLNVAEGEFVSIIGPSGCGKSTLFNVIGGLIDDHEGEVLIEGRPVDGAHKDVGVVFQEESTFPWRSTLDNVAFPLEIEGIDKDEREELARKFIKLVGLDGFEDHYPAQLSGGMKQRTAVARTLAYEPRIMLLDEPFGALDEQTRMLLGDKMLEIWAALNQTMLLITHNITEAVQLSDRVVVMSYRPGTIKEIIEIDLPRPRSSEVISTPEFGTYVGKLWTLLREEASRGMVDEEAAIAAT
ncbi:MAG: ABC transporter ATP-binding protein [Pseudomonadota bacterium]|nr:ABC transporter ATP-binding protein [Pseudomonadota bacterium]MEC8288956.1 ABC transporter ATP-binding protein [Pseudomonadota bacterium]MEC8463465.1 ABC transporter ATP-binding protein [Pseudomonadota bacterium]MEC8725111.1 ABC transporter ATP-binding protein [Pseudomonadota bacterium]MEC9208125.1 ABC transporter ATP-binding protein [Pseudomonadota bacterium]